MKDNIINLKADGVTYGITLELSQKTSIDDNDLDLSSELIYGIEATSSSENDINNNKFDANGKQVYGILISNGNYNNITSNVINANGTGEDLSHKNLDSLGAGNAGIYLKDNSTNNVITSNEITSAKGYAVLIDDGATNNVLQDNNLDSEKGSGNKAINNVKDNNVTENYKYVADASVKKIEVPYLGTGEFTITFDKSIDGAIVQFMDDLGDVFAESKVVDGVASAKFKFTSDFRPAQYVFSAKLLKEDYKASTYDIKVTITKGNIVIAVDKVSIQQGKTGNITAKLLDELGNPIKGATVEFNRINSAGKANPMGTAVSDDKGIATLSYSAATINAGLYNMTVEVNGVTNYNDAKAFSSLEITPMPSIIGGKDYSVYYGNTVKYKVQIVDTDGKAVGEGKEVTFKIKDATKTVKTDQSGYATYSAKLKAGSYTITAEYNGYNVSNVITFKPTLIAKNISKKKAKKIKFSVKLVNKKGKKLKNKKITIKVKSKKYKVKTNKKGVATLTLKNLKVGKYKVTSSYGGCTIKNTIKIKK